jgi:hypothetical protein
MVGVCVLTLWEYKRLQLRLYLAVFLVARD